MTVAGLATLAGGLVWLSFIRPDGSFTVDVLPASLVTAAGMAMAFIPSLGMALSSAAPEEGGLAAGIVNTNYQVGSALGLAAMTAVATAFGADQAGNAVAPHRRVLRRAARRRRRSPPSAPSSPGRGCGPRRRPRDRPRTGEPEHAAA